MQLIIESLYFLHSQIYIDCVPIHVKHKENMFQISNKNLPTQFLHPTKGHYLLQQGQTQVGAQKGPARRGPKFYFFIFLELLYISFLQLDPFQNLSPLHPNQPSQPNPNSNYQTQKLNKNNKNIHNDDCILAQKKTILPRMNQKIMCYWRS